MGAGTLLAGCDEVLTGGNGRSVTTNTWQRLVW